MTIEEIIHNRESLDYALRKALSTMELKTDVTDIFEKIKENQNNCPHIDTNYNWVMVDGICPYCGKKIGGQND